MRRLALAAALGGAALVVPGPSDTVQAAPDDIIAFVVEGTGHGHGRGMSQWGAFGYAVDHGRDSAWILNHYYGGTNAGTTATNERIRVRLTGYDGRGTVGVVSHRDDGVRWNGQQAPAMRAVETSPGVFRIDAADRIACPGTSTLTVPTTEVSFGSDDRDAVRQIQAFLDRFHDDGIVVDGLWGPQTEAVLASWQTAEGLPVDGRNWTGDDWGRANSLIAASAGAVTWTEIGTHTQRPGAPVRFTTPGGDAHSTGRGDVLGVCSGSGRVTHYRGAIEVIDSANGNRVANDLPVEQYLRGVVPKEISASWAAVGDGAGRQAVRAQAVAARSYGLSEGRTGDSYEYRGSDVRFATTCDTTSCQVYAGAATRSSATGNATRVEQDATDAAILATAGQVRRWPDGRIVRTEFSASNGPRTAGGSFPPVDDIGDDTSRNPSHRWTRIIDADEFADRYGLGRITSVRMVESNQSRYRAFDGIWFNDVVVQGTSGSYRDDAWDFRNAFGLRSPGFTIRPITRSSSGDSIAFIGDSVGASIAGTPESEFQRVTDGTFPTRIIDVVGGRCTTKEACLGSPGVSVARSLPQGLDLVVVELGYNDRVADFASDIDAMMTALQSRDVGRVLWVNMADIRTSGGRSTYGPANAALDAATSRWRNLEVLDWDQASDVAERVRWFSDGVHLTATGQAEFALWLRDQLLDAAPSHYLAPPKRLEIPVVGEQLVAPDGTTMTVPAGAAAVAVNVTAVRPARNGHISVWPCSADLPEVSNLNYLAGDVRANSVVAPVSPDGTICVYSHAGTEVIVDIAGWFAGGSSFVGVDPERWVDSRRGLGTRSARIGPDSVLTVPIHGRRVTTVAGVDRTIPTSAIAAAVNVTAVRPDRRGHLQVWPCDAERPRSSNVNYLANQVVANGVIAPIGGAGAVCVYAHTPTDVIVDLMGYIDGPGSDLRTGIPTRLADTRRSGERLGDGEVLEVPVVGRRLTGENGAPGPVVPSDASAVVANVTIVNADGRGHATIWPCTDPMPRASNINYPSRGATVANSAIAAVGPGGSICVYAHTGADVVVDVAGWFTDVGAFEASIPERTVDTRFAVGPVPR